MKHTPSAAGHSYTVREIESCLVIAARLVKRYGDQYRAYFCYFERELALAKERDELTDRINDVLSRG